MFERAHENRLLYVFCALHGLSEQRCYLESSRLQQAHHATSAKHLVNWDWFVFNCPDTNAVFQTASFLILVVRNNKRFPGIDGKTSDCLSRNCLYHRYLELRFCSYSNCSLDRLNLWLFFSRWFPHGNNAACKNYQIKLILQGLQHLLVLGKIVS